MIDLAAAAVLVRDLTEQHVGRSRSPGRTPERPAGAARQPAPPACEHAAPPRRPAWLRLVTRRTVT